MGPLVRLGAGVVRAVKTVRQRRWPLAVLGAMALVAAATPAVVRHSPFRAGAARLVTGDTITVWGPQQFNGSSGQGQTYVEQFTPTVTAGRLYTLHLVNGAPNGTQRASKVIIKLNGYEIVSQNEVTQSVATLDRVIALTAVDTIRVTVAGSSNPYITLSVLSTPDSSFNAYGPNQYAVASGSSTTHNQSFSRPAGAAAPYRVYVTNGASDGTLRATSASITLNGTQIVSTTELTSSVGSLTKTVTLNASNTLGVTVNGSVNRYITVRFTATDTTKPTLTITAPTPNALTNTSSITVSGTISDQTATTVTVNGTAAAVTNNTSYTATVPLPSEGNNLLTVVATDASGRHTDSTRTVIRDTQAPSLAVSAPADGTITKDATITVAATASDANGVTVNTNGTPLTPGGGGSFSGGVALAQGSNVLTTTATDGAGNTTSIVRTVTRDTVPPVLTVSAPTDGSTTQADSVTVSGTVSDLLSVTVTANGVTLPVSSGSFSGKIALAEGPNTIAVVATDAAGNTTTVTRGVTRQVPLPPDPASVATPLNPTAATSVAASTAFLYNGADPIQTGVTPGAIGPLRAAVVRGKLVDRTGAALSGVKITVLSHPELGQTYSRADGRYDLAVNGGGPLTLDYAKGGYLPAQRTVQAPWNGYAAVDSVVLVPLDTAATTIPLGPSLAVARGSAVSDAAGSRRATVMFEGGTQATMVLPNGSTQPLLTLTVRATEATVGALGPAAMPAALPATSAYTYAVELSVDEALSAGARSVEFTQPVSFYVDNFLRLPTGGVIPLGIYDRQTGRWVPEKNGRVIKLLSTNPVQVAASYPDTTTPASAALLDSLGVSAAELAQLGTLYGVGATLWRVELAHFTLIDLNLPFSLPAKAFTPNATPGSPDPDAQCRQAGSVISCERQSLGEDLGIAGTPFTLHYESDRSAGFAAARRIVVPSQAWVDTSALTGWLPRNTYPSHVLQVTYVLDAAGRRTVERRLAGATIPATALVWDGLDRFGRPVNGSVKATLSVGFSYPNTYAVATSGGGGGGFGAPSQGGSITAVSREQVMLEQVWEGRLGTWDNKAALMLGGWSLSPHHIYDPTTGSLYLGSGERRTAAALGNVARIIPATRGTFCGALSCGVPIYTRFALGQLAVDAAGRVIVPYSIEGFGPSSPGIIRVLGPSGTFVDSLPSAGAPTSVAAAPDGTIYFAEMNLNRVRRWRPTGTIEVVAGTGTAGFTGDGGPATSARLNRPAAVALGTDGSLFIADQNNHRIRRVAPDGLISTYAGNGQTTIVADGGLATATPVPSPAGVAVAPDGGVLYLSGTLVRRVSPSGRVSTVAGYAPALGPGPTPATQTLFPASLTVVAASSDGSVVFGHGPRVWRATLAGTLEVVAGTGTPRCIVLTQAIVCDPRQPADGEVASQTRLENVVGLAVGPDGTVYLAESSGSSERAFIRAIRPALPGLATGNMLVAAADGGEVYEFDATGRHLRTRDGFTGKARLVFDYDGAGRLTAVRDSLGNTTTVERDAAGAPTAIVAPFGQRTTLALDGNGYLQEVRDPAGQRVQLTHTATGLLTELRDPQGHPYRFAYDTLGRLVADSAPNGGVKSLLRTPGDTGFTVRLTTALGRATAYRVDLLSTQTEQRAVTDPAGLVTQAWRTSAGVDSTRAPDGTRTVIQRLGDPRFGAQVALAGRLVVRLPSNDSLLVTLRRTSTRSDSANPFSLTQQIDSLRVNGNLFLATYTAAQQRVTTTSPEGRQQFTTLDSLGRVRVVRTPGLDSVIYRYDPRGRLDQVQTGGRLWSYGYDTRGRLLSTLDPLGRRDSLFYDDADRLTRRVLPGGRVVQFAYDSAGNLTSLTPPGRPAHTFRHTAVDLDSLYTPPSLGTGSWVTEYRYNLDRQLTEIRRPDTVTIAFGYDTAGRPSTVTFDRGQLGLGYSATTGHLTSLTAPGSLNLSFTYDGALPKTVTWAGPVAGSVGVRYDNHFRVVRQAVNGTDSVSFGYDNDGLLKAAGQLGLKRHAQTGFVERDSVGAVLGVWSYDTKGALSGYTASTSGTPVFQTSYVRDSLSRITELTETVQGTATVLAFTYDSAGRLFEVRRDGQLTATYEYDANGNRLTLTTQNGVITGAYDAQDRLTSYGTTSYGYTRAGALRWKAVGTDTTHYTYDALGNLTTVVLPNGTQLDYLVDAQNRRVGKKINGALVQGFLYQDDLAPVAELDGTGAVVSRFVYATRVNVPDYLVKAGITYRVVADHLGSVRLVVNAATGAVAQRLDYDEFGRVTQNTNPGFQPFGYAGGLLDDATGLVRFGARDYDAATGRWTAKDPVGFGGGSANLYTYVANDPITYVDPTGLMQEGAFCPNPRDIRDRVNNWIRQLLERLLRKGALGELISRAERTKDIEEQLRDAQGAPDFDPAEARRLEQERNAGYQDVAGQVPATAVELQLDAASNWLRKQLFRWVLDRPPVAPPPGRLTPPVLPGQGSLHR